MDAAANRDDVVLEMRGISKRFPGVLALDNVGLRVRAGEIHALVGENGAGKSTLMKILSGAIQGDAGEILVERQGKVGRAEHHALEAEDQPLIAEATHGRACRLLLGGGGRRDGDRDEVGLLFRLMLGQTDTRPAFRGGAELGEV